MFHLNALLGSFARRSAWHRALHVASTAAVDAVGARATWAALPSDGWQRAIDAMESAWESMLISGGWLKVVYLRIVRSC
jgi:hypothetical protein